VADDIGALIEAVRAHPGVRGKAEIGLVREVFGDSDWQTGPGDDGAVVMNEGTALVVGGEAILPAFVAADPYGAGVAAVTTNLNDLAAMGAWPLALVDTVTGPRAVVRPVLEGMRWAAGLYGVPVVGGHLTGTAGPPSLSAFGLGRADRPLSARAAAPGQSLVVAACLDGKMRADFPFFPSFDERGDRLAGDVRLLAEGASAGWVAAAKDVSMAGLVGSLAMLLECNQLGAALDLDALPVPAGVTLRDWLLCFPCFAFGAGLTRPPSARHCSEVDHHPLMRDPGVGRQPTGPLPAEPFEERDVARLYVGLHAGPAALRGGGDGEPDQWRAQAQPPGPGQHREPVTLPQARRGQRVEPDRAADVRGGEADHVDCRRIGVVAVPVVTGPAARREEEPLFAHEHLVPDAEVGFALPLAAHRPA